MWAYLLKAIAARQDKCVQIVAAAASLNMRPSSSRLKEADPMRFAAERRYRSRHGCRYSQSLTKITVVEQSPS